MEIIIICNIAALVLFAIYASITQKIIKNSIDKELLLKFLKAYQKETGISNQEVCTSYRKENNLESAIQWQYFADGCDNAINFITRRIKDTSKLEEYIESVKK